MEIIQGGKKVEQVVMLHEDLEVVQMEGIKPD